MAVRRLAETQPASFAFSDANLAWANKEVTKYPEGRQASAVISLLWKAQEQEGWVSEPAIRFIAEFLGMPTIRVLEVATFYTMFLLAPVGKKAHIQVCGTTPCWLRGANDIKDVCRHRIHHDQFHISENGDFSWEEVECLGACVNAPMVMIWKDTYEDLTPDLLNKVLDGFETGNPPKPGPQIDRQYAAPVTGLTSLKSDAKSSVPAPTKEPVLADAEPKKQTESANVRERPAPKPPMGDASKTNPPKGDKS